MTKTETTPPDGFKQAKASSGEFEDEDANWIDRPQPGESIQGILLEMTPNCGDYENTVLRFRRTDEYEEGVGPIVLMWSNSRIDNLLESSDLGTGDEVIIDCTGKDTFERDGDVVEFYEYEVYYRA